jgi:hypothetical protein
MLRDLRLKIRNRHSRISSCGYQEFLGYSKQFFDFVKNSQTLTAMISELLARNPASVAEVAAAGPNIQIYGNTSEEAAAIAHAKWIAYSKQDDPTEFHTSVMGHTSSSRFDDALNLYRDWYVDPLFDYLDEIFEDANVILGTLTRYKQKVEWYKRKALHDLFTNNTVHGEDVLAENMYEYLFDQGIPFHTQPHSASGIPDVVSLDDSQHPFIGDVKIFDASSRGATYIKKGLYQIYRYCWDHNSAVGHLIIFNVSNKQLQLALPARPDGVPRFEYNNKTVFITVIDIHPYEEPASKRPIPETDVINADDLVKQVKEEEEAAVDERNMV